MPSPQLARTFHRLYPHLGGDFGGVPSAALLIQGFDWLFETIPNTRLHSA